MRNRESSSRMRINRANLVLDAFDEQLVSAAEVMAWAESELRAASSSADVPSWLLDLLRDGPAHFLTSSHPWRKNAGFEIRCALHATRVNLTDRDSMLEFARWLANSVARVNINDPFGVLALEVDHYLNDHADEELAVQCIRDDLLELLPRCYQLLEAARRR
jgi:hypothetical protein